MQNLISAFRDGNLRVSSSGSVHMAPEVILVHHTTIHISTASGSFDCSVSAKGGVVLLVRGKQQTPAVNANLVDDTAAWIQINGDDFWIDIHVPMLTTRQLQQRVQQTGC
jgi:hypothetical protein